MIDRLVHDAPSIAFWVLFTLGLWMAIGSQHLLRHLIGLYLIQTSVILFYLATGAVQGGTVPIIDHGAAMGAPPVYANPLPHVLMLTAIVVGVSTQGVALMLLRRLYTDHQTLLYDELRRRIDR